MGGAPLQIAFPAAWWLALAGVVILIGWLIAQTPVSAQDGTPRTTEQTDDVCIVALSAESETVKVGEPVRFWVWGGGVEPDTWSLEIDGAGSVSLWGAKEIDSGAKLVEWVVVGETEGQVTLVVSMVCQKPGDGNDTLTLTVLPAEPDAESDGASQPAVDFCTSHLSVSGRQVSVGDHFQVWFVGVGTEPGSWTLNMEGDGTARVVGTQALDPEYVEWTLEAVDPGAVNLKGEMTCQQPGGGISTAEVLITTPGNYTEGIPTARPEQGSEVVDSGQGNNRLGTIVVIETGLMAVLLAVLVTLAYLLRRRD